MPILKPEADIFPADLFDLPRETYPWWVAHVRSRQEKAVAREARTRAVPSFLPQVEKVWRTEGRRRVSSIPLFAGYLFFRGGLDERAEIMQTHLCVRVLEVQDQLSLETDLLQIRRLQLSGLPLVAHPELKVGDPVRIGEGPFRGVSGVILKEKGRHRLIVSVRFIHRSVSVELARDEVDPEPVRSGRSMLSNPRVSLSRS